MKFTGNGTALKPQYCCNNSQTWLWFVKVTYCKWNKQQSGLWFCQQHARATAILLKKKVASSNVLSYGF